MHLAPTREQARAEMAHGVLKLVGYCEKIANGTLPDGTSVEAALDQWENEGLTLLGRIVVGTPDDAIERIEALQKQAAMPLGQPEDVAELVLYLASDAARYVNGAEIAIDAGLTAG